MKYIVYLLLSISCISSAHLPDFSREHANKVQEEALVRKWHLIEEQAQLWGNVKAAQALYHLSMKLHDDRHSIPLFSTFFLYRQGFLVFEVARGGFMPHQALYRLAEKQEGQKLVGEKKELLVPTEATSTQENQPLPAYQQAQVLSEQEAALNDRQD